MKADPQRILLDVRKATTDDLLDRATAYRAGMTPEALALIEAELQDRGVGPEQFAAHAESCRQEVLFLPDGIAARCSFCDRPAVARAGPCIACGECCPSFRAASSTARPTGAGGRPTQAFCFERNLSTSACVMRVLGLSIWALSQLMTALP